MEFKIKNEEIRQLMNIDVVTQILNLANQNAQATRPKVVGQMSELIKEFTGKSLEEWEDWYIKKHPDAIEKATKKILEMINNFRDVIDKIDENMIRLWVRDLVIVKTFIGLRFQEAILKKIADYFKTSFSLASPEDESKGIDGYVNKIPISIKPKTYSSKKMLSEKIEVHIVFYEKQKDGIKITISSELENLLTNKGTS
jgi:hypothetical protein